MPQLVDTTIRLLSQEPLAGKVPTGEVLRIASILDRAGSWQVQARTNDLVFSVPRLIAELSSVLSLLPGDVIFTGTPAGVGAVVAGDRLDGGIEGRPKNVIFYATSNRRRCSRRRACPARGAPAQPGLSNCRQRAPA